MIFPMVVNIVSAENAIKIFHAWPFLGKYFFLKIIVFHKLTTGLILCGSGVGYLLRTEFYMAEVT